VARRCEDVPVLVLDGDDDFRNALTELLQDDGHAVRAYPSVTDVPPLAALPPPAAVIADYQLADGENGLAFAARFNAVHPRVAVIILTAHVSDHVTQSVAAAPYLSLLWKPCRYEELHELLHRRGMESLGA